LIHFYKRKMQNPSELFRKTSSPNYDSGFRDKSLYFEDGRRRIDIVLVYQEDKEGPAKEITEKRLQFQEELVGQGLQLETSTSSNVDVKTTFVKVHASWPVLVKYAEILNLKMPIKIAGSRYNENFTRGGIWSYLEKVSSLFDYNYAVIPPDPDFFTAGFLKDREDKFIIKDREAFFSSAQRSQIVWQILLRTPFIKDRDDKVGINRLLNKNVYEAAYPLHEGRIITDNPHKSDRELLYTEWAHISNFYKRQPLWLIKKYFGDKIGLYFAWLGFYNQMLVPPALLGLAVTLYGACTLNNEDYNIVSTEICDDKERWMCPECEQFCPYRRLSDSCELSWLSYVFDNSGTVYFAFFMSLWAALFVEIWKRRQSIIAWKWDLEMDDIEEQTRPEYETTVKSTRMNPVTKTKEAYLPPWNKSSRVFLTYSLVLFMLCAVVAAVGAVIFYRIVILATIFQTVQKGEDFFSYARILASGSAATLNLIFIVTLNKVYEYVALWLVTFERPRTQSEYEQSFTFKMFFFQCINFYSSLIYIAFFKGKFFQHPGELVGQINFTKSWRQDKCDTVGCWYELTIQLALIMIGKQILNNIIEILLPKVINMWKVYTNKLNKDEGEAKCWEADYNLQAWGQLALFDEYLEMVIQYGFVTLFVAAFPLAPLFALINNIFEIRIDAHKYLVQVRRPKAQKAQDIGAWIGILQTISYFAIATNALVIAVSSNYVNRMVYLYNFQDSPDQSLAGYVQFSLTAFNTSYWPMSPTDPTWPGPISWRERPDAANFTCYFPAMREEGPGFALSERYFFIIMAKFAFVIIFEHLVFGIVGMITCFIPDIPESVKIQVQREKMIAREALFETEAKDDATTPRISSIESDPRPESSRATFHVQQT